MGLILLSRPTSNAQKHRLPLRTIRAAEDLKAESMDDVRKMHDKWFEQEHVKVESEAERFAKWVVQDDHAGRVAAERRVAC